MVREFILGQRTFIVSRKLQRATLPTIRREYEARWPRNTWHVVNAPPPATPFSLRRLVRKFVEHGTVQDRRKKRPSGREGVTTAATPDAVDEVTKDVILR